MNAPGPYTCADYRKEMILLGLRQRLADPHLSEKERQRLQEQRSRLERDLGMD